MESTNHHGEPDTTMAQVVEALFDLRDELVKVSLMLQDFQFDFDSAKRCAAAGHTRELMEKVKPR